MARIIEGQDSHRQAYTCQYKRSRAKRGNKCLPVAASRVRNATALLELVRECNLPRRLFLLLPVALCCASASYFMPWENTASIESQKLRAISRLGMGTCRLSVILLAREANFSSVRISYERMKDHGRGAKDLLLVVSWPLTVEPMATPLPRWLYSWPHQAGPHPFGYIASI